VKKGRKEEYYLQDDGKFVIENYDLAKPFASFFPGIAGPFGIPMWVFYVNRGQGVVSFGIEGKKSAMLEFFPANRAWQFVSRRGFRTFIKQHDSEQFKYYEPFRNKIMTHKMSLNRKMLISSEDFSLVEDNRTLGLKFEVDYYTLANEPLSALIRNLTVKNTGRSVKKLEIIDGLPQVVPYGANDRFLKELGRTIEAWMQVKHVTKYKVPFYKLSVDPTDSPQVIYVKGGNYYYSYGCLDNKSHKRSFIIDPQLVFGAMNTLNYPRVFFRDDFELPAEQISSSKTPSAFSYYNDIVLKPKQEITITSIMGYARNEKLLQSLITKTENPNFLKTKYADYKKEIRKVQNNIFTVSSNPTYDLYCKQTYLDNALRGGLPITLQGKDKPHVFHIYSRKHGDLERDYNNFLTEATYLSQGNGNFRDVNQNRRDDVWFNTAVKDANIRAFFNLIQLDGFNPLIVYGDIFKLRNDEAFKDIASFIKNKEDVLKVQKYLKEQFSLGALFMFIETNEIKITVSKERFLREILGACKRQQNAEHGDGFWVDHWTYNLDALESYLAIYPEKLKDILLYRKKFVYFNNFVKVKPRDEKYILYNDCIRQYHSVSLEEIEEDSAMARQIKTDDWAVRTELGKGSVHKTTMLVKMICLIANKMASLDAFGCGIEMEANKPGWYDALNGLPGLFGSSVCEAFELKRLIDFILSCFDHLKIDKNMSVSLPMEIYSYFKDIGLLVDNYLADNSPDRDMVYWDKSYTIKEAYRKIISKGISGKMFDFQISELNLILEKMSEKLKISLSNSKDKKTGLYHTYFINEVISYDKIKTTTGFKMSSDNFFCVRPKQFKQKALPLFLEAQVHALKCEKDIKKIKTLYEKTKKSDLYDKELKMFKVNASLDKVTKDIGRARAFTSGWLENESVWLHMEYKFILELLRKGLYEEFFTEFKNVLVPFQPPERYGRSILENSSFIVSSAFPDKSLHGNGFVARLSGSTAEFITMWLWMNVGRNPFRLDANNNLVAGFTPALPAWMFTDKKKTVEYCVGKGRHQLLDLPKNSYAFKFLTSTLVVYHNPKGKNTFGKDGVHPVSMVLKPVSGKKISIDSGIMGPENANLLREGKISRIDIILG
jgi:hypothetical protein